LKAQPNTYRQQIKHTAVSKYRPFRTTLEEETTGTQMKNKKQKNKTPKSRPDVNMVDKYYIV